MRLTWGSWWGWLPVPFYLSCLTWMSHAQVLYICVSVFTYTHIYIHTHIGTHTHTHLILYVCLSLSHLFLGVFLCVNVFCKFICAFLGAHTYTHSRTHLVFFYCVCSYRAPLLFSSLSLLLTNICLFFHILIISLWFE